MKIDVDTTLSIEATELYLPNTGTSQVANECWDENGLSGFLPMEYDGDDIWTTSLLTHSVVWW